MRSHFATASRRNFRRHPLAFTEHGAIMLAMVLNSPTAVEASVHVVRAFVKMREVLSTQVAVQKKLDQIEERLGEHDVHLLELFSALKQLIGPPPRGWRRIGFKMKEK